MCAATRSPTRTSTTGRRIELPKRLRIPIEVDLGDRYNLPADDSFDGDVQVGTVEVDLETGRATFNGQALTSEAEAALRARCQEVLADSPADQ